MDVPVPANGRLRVRIAGMEQREGAMLGGEQSGHVIYLRDHVTGDGLAAGLLLCGALKGRRLSVIAAAMHRFPQAKENVRVDNPELTPAIVAEVERLNRDWDGAGRVLVRPSGTEPLIRVLAEARSAALAAEEAGASVLVIERAPRDQRGGNTAFTAGSMRVAYRGVEDIQALVPGPARPHPIFTFAAEHNCAALAALGL